jgi:serine/threonine-protein kinase
MQPATEPYASGAPTTAAGAVGGGMLPGSPVDDDYGYGPRRDRRAPEQRGRGWSYALLGLGVLLVAGLVIFTILKVTGGSSDVKSAAVPPVQGLKLDQALSQLSAVGFTNVDHSQTKADDSVPAGSVLTQDPPSGQTVAVTKQITLVLSSGPNAVSVPDVTGKSQNDATAALQQAGLQIGSITEKDNKNYKQGQVISTNPDAGSSAAKGTKVNLVVASGNVQLPDLKGKTLQEATNALTKLGLTTNPTFVDAQPGQQVGIVVAQNPGKGSVQVGSTVNISVTKPGTPPTPTPTPSDSGQPSPSSSPSPS